MRKRLLLLVLALLIPLGIGAYYATRPDNPVTWNQADPSPKKPGVFRIAFGSCNKQWKSNPMWKAVVNCKPDVWIWLGDSIYAPTEDMAYLRSQYELQKRKSEYQQLIQTC